MGRTQGRRRRAPRLGLHLSSSPEAVLIDDADLVGRTLMGDHSGLTASLVQLSGCRIEGAQLVGTHLENSRLVDCVVIGCDLSGLTLADSACTRVEFRDCRLSGLQAANSRFADVAFLRCRIDGANFRMTT
ncbi:MAG: pentapeptide repeat-containing protein [Actinomycetota bacterium]|nr:pentapeptide repeat-containing protein [Actinomycetota bacterium]